jgi:putative transcriptional regulator
MPKQYLQGALLLDGGKLQGTFFQRSVILICRHDADGAFGLILNRPIGSTIGDAIVADIPVSLKKRPLFLGGPVQPETLSYLHTDALEDALEETGDFMGGLNLGHSLDGLVDAEEGFSPTRRLKLFAGYSGWGAGQLEGELARNDWLVHRPATLDIVFCVKPEELWKSILKEKGPTYRLIAERPEDLSWN